MRGRHCFLLFSLGFVIEPIKLCLGYWINCVTDYNSCIATWMTNSLNVIIVITNSRLIPRKTIRGVQSLSEHLNSLRFGALDVVHDHVTLSARHAPLQTRRHCPLVMWQWPHWHAPRNQTIFHAHLYSTQASKPGVILPVATKHPRLFTRWPKWCVCFICILCFYIFRHALLI